MSEPKILRTSRTYDIKLKIKGESYTNDVSNVKILSSLATGYQIVIITLNLTPENILVNKLFGQDEIKLDITKLDETEYQVTETMNFDLMIVNSEFEVAVSNIVVTDVEQDRSAFDLITVTRIPFETMTTMVNPVFGIGPGGAGPWTGPKTPKEMIETIVDELITTNPTLEYDTVDENTDKILQMCIPPTTLYKAIKEIDKNYGLYNGAPIIFCQYDNRLQIMNLSDRIKKNYNLLIQHLTTEASEEDITQSVSDPKYFYTYDNLYTNYTGNSKFGVLGETIKHIVLPSDMLFHTIEQKLSTICNTTGVVGQTKGQTSYVNTSAAKRTKYYIENNGYETSEVFATSQLSKEIADASRLSFDLERNLAMIHLIEVGCCVKLKTKTIQHQDISGKYILFSSDLNWHKGSEWQTTASIELVRTNKI